MGLLEDKNKVMSDTELLALVEEAFDESFEIVNLVDGWKEEKKSDTGDLVVSRKSKRHGRKIYRVTATINCNAKTLVDKWIKSGDDFCSWNKTLLEFKILKKISDTVALTYQVTTGGGPGDIVASRDFVLVSKETWKGDTWVQGGCSINYPDAPKHAKAVRAENGPTCMLIKHLTDTTCEFRWLMDCEYKGWIPKSVLDFAMPFAQMQFVESVRDLAKR